MIELLGFICIGLGIWLCIIMAYLVDKFKGDRYEDM
jgi:hypothetical protein